MTDSAMGQTGNTSKLDPVIALQIDGHLNEAFIKLAEFAKDDPTILQTTVGVNLAMTLTDLPRDAAIAKVLTASQMVSTPKNVQSKTKKTQVPAGDWLDALLASALLLLVFIVSFGIARVGAVPLTNRMLSNLKGVTSQYSAGNTTALANAMTALTNGQTVDPQALAALEKQMQSGQLNSNSPEFRATIIAGILQSLSHTQINSPSPKTIIVDTITSALYLFAWTLITTLAIYLVGVLIGGKGGVFRFVYHMTRANLIIYGLVFVALAIWFLVLSVPTMNSTLQSILIVIGILLVMVSVLFGFRLQIGGAMRAMQFGGFRGFIAVFLGSLVVTLVIGWATIAAVLPRLR